MPRSWARRPTAVVDWLLDHPKVRYAKAASTDPLPEFLSVSEAKHLITFLSDTRPRPWLSHTRRNSHVVLGQCAFSEKRALLTGSGTLKSPEFPQNSPKALPKPCQAIDLIGFQNPSIPKLSQ